MTPGILGLTKSPAEHGGSRTCTCSPQMDTQPGSRTSPTSAVSVQLRGSQVPRDSLVFIILWGPAETLETECPGVRGEEPPPATTWAPAKPLSGTVCFEAPVFSFLFALSSYPARGRIHRVFSPVRIKTSSQEIHWKSHSH